MKGKFFSVVLAAVVGAVLLLYATRAQANIAPELTVESVFSALNAGNVEMALASFSEDATAENQVLGERYEGVDEIRQMLVRMSKPGRRLDVVDTASDGNRITVQAEISDGGMVWGTETIVAELKDGKVQSFAVTAVRLELWKAHR